MLAAPMTGLHEVDCGACGKRHVMSAARARSQRVLRCDCGQFVRLDRALTETRSDPAPAPVAYPKLANADDDDEDETQMFSSLEAIAALGGASGNRASRASLFDKDDAAATRVASSPVNLPLPAAPPARPSSPVRASSPVQSAPGTGTEKPLWYVDLGGAEKVEMTIEQLIIARRSGKLGEGALVWRAGMPGWRSVGSLIPAAGSGAPRQTLPPAAPVRNKEPPAPVRNKAPALGSYERPLATLEFALETPDPSAPRQRPSQTPGPAKSRPAPQPPRVLTPVPRLTARGASQVGPLPVPAPLPTARRPTPLPPAPAAPPMQAMSTVSPLMGRASPMPSPRVLVPAVFQYPWRGQRPRWLSVGIAVLVCIAASGSGAFLVRALKLRRQPLSLSPTQLSTTQAPTNARPSLLSTPSTTVPAALPVTAASTAVVDIDSLSVERRARRAPVRPLAPPTPTTAVAAPSIDKNAGNADSDDVTTPAATPQPSSKKAKTSDLPAAAHSNPYTTGTVGESPTKKAAPSTGDDPGF